MTNVLEIVKYPNPILETVCEPIESITEEIKSLVGDMLVTLAAAKNGVGLAAPQVGVIKRLFVMDTRCVTGGQFEIFINPKIVARQGSCKYNEGCLSSPGINKQMKRYRRVRVEYTNLSGDLITQEFEGLSSICIQHEIDHLNGIHFLSDKAGI